MPSIRKNPSTPQAPVPARRRMPAAEREQQLVEGAIRFFSRHGLGGQLRDLARELGITHTLLYHYFPTKQALLERVYKDILRDAGAPSGRHCWTTTDLNCPKN